MSQIPQEESKLAKSCPNRPANLLLANFRSHFSTLPYHISAQRPGDGIRINFCYTLWSILPGGGGGGGRPCTNEKNNEMLFFSKASFARSMGTNFSADALSLVPPCCCFFRNETVPNGNFSSLSDPNNAKSVLSNTVQPAIISQYLPSKLNWLAYIFKTNCKSCNF